MSETQQQNDNQTQQPAPSAPENQPQQPQAPQQQGQSGSLLLARLRSSLSSPSRTPMGICHSRAKTLKASNSKASGAHPCSTSTPKDAKKQMMSRPPQRVSIISAILFFVVAMFIGSQMMTMMNGAETDTLITSEFVQAVEQDRVQDVVANDAGSYTVTGTYYPAATAWLYRVRCIQQCYRCVECPSPRRARYRLRPRLTPPASMRKALDTPTQVHIYLRGPRFAHAAVEEQSRC